MKNVTTCVMTSLLVLALSACGPRASGPDEDPATAPTEPTAATAPPPPASSSSVEALLREKYADFAPDVYIFQSDVDLNGDGADESIVHVVSPMLCGTGGCNTLVFTPRGDRFELVGDITVTRPPIRVSTDTTNGWRNLIVHISGGGVPVFEGEITFDGSQYQSNPTAPMAQPAADLDSAEIVIPEFETLTDGTRLFTE